MYHGTDLKTGKIIIESQRMEPSRGDHHWLGDGIYFYRDQKYAFRWIIIKYTQNFQNSRALDYKKISQEYIILTAELKSDKIFDLDNLEMKLFFLDMRKIILDKSDQSERIQKQLNESGFSDGVVLNVLFEKMGLSASYDCVKATFPISYLDNTGSRLDYIPELQICVKNPEIIENIKEFNIEDHFWDFREFIDLYRKIKYQMKNSSSGDRGKGQIYKKSNKI